MKTGLLLNPRQPASTANAAIAAWRDFSRRSPDIFLTDSIGISTSGSTSGGVGSIIILSRQALEVSAAAVNRQLGTSPSDVWGLALPTFHVGGYSILVRASIAGSRVVSYERDWEARGFHEWLQQECVTLLSLVPTQLFDLIEAGLKSPAALRAVVVGGGRLDESLHQRARALGWPILQSYGMTECCSQIATADLGSDGRTLRVLDHVELKTNANSKLLVKSQALLSARITFDSNLQPHLESPVTADGWFETSDRAELVPTLRIFGREGETVKVMGELVDLVRVRAACEAVIDEAQELAKLRQKNWVVSIPDERRENELVLILEAAESSENQALSIEILQRLKAALAPFEVPSRVMFVDLIPRSSLGKILSSLLTEKVRAGS